MNLSDELAAVPLLAALAAREREALAAASRVVRAQPGDVLFPEFAVSDALWLLLEGRWRVVRRVAGVEHLMFEADLVGTWTCGIPIIDRIAQPKVEVLAASRFLAIPIQEVERIVAGEPVVAKRLLEAVGWGAQHIGGLISE